MQIFDLFDVKQRGVIDFGDFVRALNVFHPSISQEDKIDCKLLAFSGFREISVYCHQILLKYYMILQSHSSFMIWMARVILSGKR